MSFRSAKNRSDRRCGAYYGWAEKNTRPKFVTDEKKRNRTNGLLTIDLLTADCHFVAKKRAKSEEIAHYFADLATYYQANGIKKLDIFLDRNPTHKAKMQGIFNDLTMNLTIKTKFHLMAAYSPKLNLVEYAIHLIRQKVLHHADCKNDLAQSLRRTV